MKVIEKLALKESKLMSEEIPTIAFLGDSVTQGCFEIYIDKNDKVETVFDYEHAYHKYLRDMLALFYPKSPVNIINAGASGGSAEQGLKRLKRDVIRYNPDLVVVSFGLNDACNESDSSLETYKESLKKIFAEIKKSGSDVIFMTANMMNTYVVSKIKKSRFEDIAKFCMEVENSGRLKQFFDAGIEVANEMDVPVCDVYSKWRKMAECGVDTTKLLSNDINHPTREMNWLFAHSLVETMFNN